MRFCQEFKYEKGKLNLIYIGITIVYWLNIYKCSKLTDIANQCTCVVDFVKNVKNNIQMCIGLQYQILNSICTLNYIESNQ